MSEAESQETQAPAAPAARPGEAKLANSGLIVPTRKGSPVAESSIKPPQPAEPGAAPDDANAPEPEADQQTTPDGEATPEEPPLSTKDQLIKDLLDSGQINANMKDSLSDLSEENLRKMLESTKTPEEELSPELKVIQAKFNEYWGSGGKFELTFAAQLNPEISEQIYNKYRLEVRQQAEAALPNKPEDQTDEEFIQDFVESYFDQNRTALQAEIESVVAKKAEEDKNELKDKPLDEALAKLSGEEVGSEAFKKKKQSLMDSLVKGGMSWIVDYASSIPDVDFGTIWEFMMNPTAYGRSSSGKFERATEEKGKVIDVLDFQGKLKTASKSPEGRKEFVGAFQKAFDTEGGLNTVFRGDSDLKKKIEDAQSGEPEAIRNLMETFLKELFKDETEKKWVVVKTKLAAELYGKNGKVFSQDIGNFFDELHQEVKVDGKGKDGPKFKEYFPPAGETAPAQPVQAAPTAEATNVIQFPAAPEVKTEVKKAA